MHHERDIQLWVFDTEVLGMISHLPVHRVRAWVPELHGDTGLKRISLTGLNDCEVAVTEEPLDALGYWCRACVGAAG